MKLDVAAATLIGTPMPSVIAGTFMNPPPTPSMPDTVPATSEAAAPSARRFAP